MKDEGLHELPKYPCAAMQTKYAAVIPEANGWEMLTPEMQRVWLSYAIKFLPNTDAII